MNLYRQKNKFPIYVPDKQLMPERDEFSRNCHVKMVVIYHTNFLYLIFPKFHVWKNSIGW